MSTNENQQGLLDGIDDENAVEQEVVEVSHLEGDDPPSPAERPEWLPENFWKDGNADYEALAKSWRDLRGKISKGQHNAPADGKYDTTLFKSTDDPMAGAISNWANENGLSQAQFDDLVIKLQDTAQSLSSEYVIDVDTEIKKLGPNGRAKVDAMAAYGRGLLAKNVFDKSDFDEFKIWGGTAAGINALRKFIEYHTGTQPGLESTNMSGYLTKDDLNASVADPRWHSDRQWRREIEDRWTREQSRMNSEA